MADSQTERTRENRFSKALLGRVVAVGLFVALGTGAVIFMMGREKKQQSLANETEQKPVIEKTASTAGFTEQIKTSFADGQGQPAQFDPKATPTSPPTQTELPKSTTNFSDTFLKQQNNTTPPDRFAALDRPGTPAQIKVETPKQDTPIRVPEIKAVQPESFGKLPTTNPNPALAQPANQKSSEPLKPFEAPALQNRMNSAPDANAPQLKAPIPSFENELKNVPKVANNPFEKIGNASPNGVLKPFTPPPKQFTNDLGNQEPSDSDRLFDDAPNSNPNLNKPNLNSPPSERPADFAASNRMGISNPDPNPTTPQNMLPSRPMARPVSGPISTGSPINQPAPDAMRPANPGSDARMFEGIDSRTANVPGDRKLDGIQAPALTVEKLSPQEITVNEVADFVIVIRNVGRVVANDVFVHDQVPANTEFQGANPTPQQSANADRKLQWQIGTLAPGQEKRIQYQLKPLTPGEIGSVAYVTFSTQASMRTKVTNPVLEIVHRTKPVSMIGSDVIFDVMISNKGNGPAKDVLIQEDVPPQLQYQEGFRELEYEIGTLMPGQSKRVQLGLKAVAVGRLRNVVVASAAGGQRVKHELEMEVVAPKLVLQADGPTKRFLGRQVANQFRIANQGTASSTNVDLVAKLPAGLRFMQANNQGVYRQATHSVHWSMAELAANGDASVELLTMPIADGTQDIKFEAMADLNQTAAITHPLNIEHLVDIFFDIDDLVDPIEVGADTAYQLKIANQGTQLANNVQLQVELPNGVSPTAVEGNLQNQIAGQRVQFAPINNLKPGEQLTVIIRAKGQAPGDHRVVVTMQADGRLSAVTKEEITRVYADR